MLQGITGVGDYKVKFMHKYRYFIFIATIGAFIFITFMLWQKNKSLEARFDTLNQYVYSQIKVEGLSADRTFKEDYYINQLNNNTNLILTCFGLGFALVSFLTYQSVTKSVADEVNQMHANYKIHKDEFESQEKALLDLRIELHHIAGNNYLVIGNTVYKTNQVAAVDYYLMACEDFAKAFMLEKNDELFNIELIKIITHSINTLSLWTENVESMRTTNIPEDQFNERVKTISNVVDIETQKKLLIIATKFIFDNNK